VEKAPLACGEAYRVPCAFHTEYFHLSVFSALMDASKGTPREERRRGWKMFYRRTFLAVRAVGLFLILGFLGISK